MNTYILDKDNNVVYEPDKSKWAKWFNEADRTVDYTCVSVNPDVNVSTVFTGMDYDFVMGKNDNPLVFETMVFGGKFDRKLVRTRSHSEAVKAHKAMCDILESLNA